MSLSNPNKPVTEQRLQEFYHKIAPYMGGGGGGGGHTIEDNEGTSLTQRDTLQFGDGLNVSDDSENEKTVVEPNLMTAADMDDVVTPLPSVRIPSVQSRYQKYSTEEQIVGKWIDGKPLYQKTFITTTPNAVKTAKFVDIGAFVQNVVNYSAVFKNNSYQHQLIAPCQITNDFAYYGKILVNDNSANTQKNTIEILTSNSNWLNKDLVITIYYTKTTDSANSYNYADENDYSTTEHIVGKWIDNKPIYQKTISSTVTKSSDGNEVITRINIGASVANVIKIDGFVKGGAATYALNTAKIKNSVVTVLRTTANDNTSDTNPNVVTISCNQFRTSDVHTYTAYVTLQYTKTTD